MTDYDRLIDAETWAFVRETDRWYPADAVARSIAEQRQVYDAMCRAFFRGYPAGVTARDERVAGVPCRRYPGAGPVVIYLHGGGFVVGGLHSHDDVCAEIRAATGLEVLSVDYRLCPEHRHPAAFDDVMAVARAQGGPFLLVGDSAGGNLAAAASHALRAAGPQPLGQVLIYPGLGGPRDRGSYLTHAHAPMLTAADIDFYATIRFDGAAPAGDPTASPLQDRDFAGLPPSVIVSAECDPLADEGPAYAAAITAAGGRARALVEPGLVHGYLRARATVTRARDSFGRIARAIAGLARGDWPVL